MELQIQEDLTATGVDELDDFRAHPREKLAADLENIHDISETAHKRGRLLIALDVERHDELGIHRGAC